MKAMLHALLLAVSLCCSTLASAKGLLLEVTPAQPKAAGFAFDFQQERLADGGVKFRAVVTDDDAKAGEAASATLSFVQIAAGPGGLSQSLRSQRQLTLEREGRTLVCTFSLTAAEARQPELCFVLTIPDGQHPAATFIYARLDKFVPKQP